MKAFVGAVRLSRLQRIYGLGKSFLRLRSIAKGFLLRAAITDIIITLGESRFGAGARNSMTMCGSFP
jgi:hypothetical protein